MPQSLRSRLPSLVFTLIALALAGCSHTEKKDIVIETKGVRISFPGFFRVTSEDLAKLVKATRQGVAASTVTLSGERAATCANESCEIVAPESRSVAKVSRD